MDGTAGTAFMKDAIALIRQKWIPADAGRVPNLSLQWGIKAIGHANSRYDEIIISFDSEDAQIYSLISRDPDPGRSAYDWLHEVSITIDVRTGQSDDRALQIVDEVVRIFKSNVVTTVNRNEYISIIPEGITNANEEYRNLYRYLVSVNATRFNP